MPMMSPWGIVQDADSCSVRGVCFVGTASHGGLRLSKALAEKSLPEYVRNMAIFYGGYYFYEEDCLWAVPCYVSEFLNKAVKEFFPRIDQTKFDDSILSTLNMYFPEVLSLKKAV